MHIHILFFFCGNAYRHVVKLAPCVVNTNISSDISSCTYVLEALNTILNTRGHSVQIHYTYFRFMYLSCSGSVRSCTCLATCILLCMHISVRNLDHMPDCIMYDRIIGINHVDAGLILLA
jgi:hypothetical protein